MSGQDYTQLTLFQADSRASLSASPGSGEAKTTTAISGRKCSELFASCDPVGLLERMLLGSSGWHSTIFSFSWKRKDTKQGHSYFQLMPLEHYTREIESPLWPTPVAMDGKMESNADRVQMLLKGMTTFKSKKSKISASIQGLNNWVSARCAKQSGAIQIGFANPEFVEWLMGYPIGWTG